jgi:hypothetical protein
MKNKELIEKLLKENPELEVITEGCDCNAIAIEIEVMEDIGVGLDNRIEKCLVIRRENGVLS